MLMQESGRVRRPAGAARRSPWATPASIPGAAMIGGLVDVMGMFLQGGWVDVGFLAGSQIDKYGNINTTVIGDYDSPKSRLPGSGGANPIGALAKRVLIIALHDTRSLAEKVDFITTPGYLDGPGAREKWGLPPGTGPQVMITNKAVMRFDKDTKEAYLASYHPGTSVDEVVKLTPWDLKVSDDVHETEPPAGGGAQGDAGDPRSAPDDQDIRKARIRVSVNRLIAHAPGIPRDTKVVFRNYRGGG